MLTSELRANHFYLTPWHAEARHDAVSWLSPVTVNEVQPIANNLQVTVHHPHDFMLTFDRTIEIREGRVNLQPISEEWLSLVQERSEERFTRASNALNFVAKLAEQS